MVYAHFHFSSVQFSHSVMSDSLPSHEWQHARLPCLSLSPGVCSNSSTESVIPFNHLILCHPLLLPPSIFPSIRVFSSESVVCIRWPKYWSFNFSLSPSHEYSGLISFKIDWFDLLAGQGTLRSLLQHHSSKVSILWSRGDRILAELFKLLKDDAVKVLHSICQQIRKTQQWPQDWKMSVFMPIPKNGIAKEYSNYCCFYLFIYYCEYCCNNHGSENTILRTNFKIWGYITQNRITALMVVPLAFYWRNPIAFFMLTALFYIPSNSIPGLYFFHGLAETCYQF